MTEEGGGLDILSLPTVAKGKKKRKKAVSLQGAPPHLRRKVSDGLQTSCRGQSRGFYLVMLMPIARARASLPRLGYLPIEPHSRWNWRGGISGAVDRTRFLLKPRRDAVLLGARLVSLAVVGIPFTAFPLSQAVQRSCANAGAAVILGLASGFAVISLTTRT